MTQGGCNIASEAPDLRGVRCPAEIEAMIDFALARTTNLISLVVELRYGTTLRPRRSTQRHR